MKAVLIEAFQAKPKIQYVEDPRPADDSVIVAVKATGICRSDWHGWMGHDPDIVLPHIPGHELAGEIVELGSEVKNFGIGDRVTVPFSCGCGGCEQCISANHQICDDYFQPGFTHWGSFAEYVEIKYAATNLVQLPEGYSFEMAAILGCRFGTAFRALVDQAQVRAGQKVLIVGCGGVGLSALMISLAIGAEVICVDKQEKAINKAKSLGAHHTILFCNLEDTIAEIKAISKGGCHVGVDAIGHPEAVNLSLTCLAKRGKHIQVGLLSAHNNNINVDGGSIISRELEIIGSHGIQAWRYRAMLDFIQSSGIDIKAMIGQRLSLDQGIPYLMEMGHDQHEGVGVIVEF